MNLKPLKGFNSFNIVFERGRKFRSGDIFIVVCAKDDLPDLNKTDFSDPKNLYFGVTAGKKISKEAVVRNRIKRLLRESVRQHFKNAAATGYQVIILSWTKPVEKPSLIRLEDVKPQVEIALKRASQIYKRRNEEGNTAGD